MHTIIDYKFLNYRHLDSIVACHKQLHCICIDHNMAGLVAIVCMLLDHSLADCNLAGLVVGECMLLDHSLADCNLASHVLLSTLIIISWPCIC